MSIRQKGVPAGAHSALWGSALSFGTVFMIVLGASHQGPSCLAQANSALCVGSNREIAASPSSH